MTTIEKIRAEFVEQIEESRRRRDDPRNAGMPKAYYAELDAQHWDHAISILDKHAAEAAKDQPKESSGPMPWRLQIAAIFAMTPQVRDFAEALALADKLIAEHERTK